MNAFKLSLRNIKKSIKDYSIYFFTLVVAVTIFYIFNSLDSQNSMLILNDSKYEIIQTLIQLLGYVSVFISCVLGFLIIYSNNFIIKRRKKEFGLYLTLGMSKRKVSTILVIETFLVGIISLGVGLLCGVFLSQFLSIFVAKMFEVNLTSYKFIFSSVSLIKTLIYFGIIFLLVMIFNLISLSRYKLIDLITASKKNEKIKIKNKYLILITFILAIGLLIYAYKLLFSGVLFAFDKKVIIMILCGGFGTFLLFYSVSGFFLSILKKIKRFYYKDLNMFIAKQINNKVNTTVISTTIICLLLLFTIGLLSGSMSLISVFNSDIENNNLTDFTVSIYNQTFKVLEDGTFEKLPIENHGNLDNLVNNKELNKYTTNYAKYNVYYQKGINYSSLMTKKTIEELKKQYGNALNLGGDVDIIKESDYNKIMKLYNKKEIDLGKNKYLLTATVEKIVSYYEPFYQGENSTLTINNIDLIPYSKKIEQIALSNFSTDGNAGTLIVPDEAVDNLEIFYQAVIGNYNKSKDTEKMEKNFLNFIADANLNGYSYATKIEVQNNNVGTKAIITFIGLYLGIIFAITSATVLAIGQLSEASDNKQRYKILSSIGVDEKVINKTLFTQIAIAFMLPFGVALFHAYFGLRELNKTIQLFGDIKITKNILITTLFIVIVYGGYFMATYICSKNIIKEK